MAKLKSSAFPSGSRFFEYSYQLLVELPDSTVKGFDADGDPAPHLQLLLNVADYAASLTAQQFDKRAEELEQSSWDYYGDA